MQNGAKLSERRSKRQRTQNVRLKDYVTQLNTVTTDVTGIPIPKSIKEARLGPHAKQWECAIKTENNALLSNKTWELVPLPSGRRALGCHWIFSVKRHANGEVERF